MVIDSVSLELRRTPATATLLVQGKPYGLELTITFTELDQFIRELTDAATTWRRERNTVRAEWYAVLGVPRSATDEEVRDAYRRLARQYHPDTSTYDSTAAMTQLNDAYAVLGDPQQRQHYDATLTS